MDARGRPGAEVLAEEDGHAGDVGAGHGGAHLVLDVAVEGVDNTPHRVDRPPHLWSTGSSPLDDNWVRTDFLSKAQLRFGVKPIRRAK